MNRRILGFAGLVMLAALAFSSPGALAATRTSILASGGYNGGPGGHLGVTLRDFAEHFPLGVRFGVGYSGASPGDPWAARSVFINENENGTPQKNGRRWDYRLDALWRTHWGPFDRLDLVAGPRISRFAAEFNFIGGNEFFDVVTTQWGFGGGAEASYPINGRFDLVIGGGLDYFLNAPLSGHDTTYSPDGTCVNQIENYGWKDADAAVNQPKMSPRLMIGVQQRIGR
jgi:hypothetical protein